MSEMHPSRPSRRQGWTWTLIKCGLATFATSVSATVGLLIVLQKLLDRLPGWLPPSWVRWLFEWTLRHVWFLGPIVGIVLGLLVSSVIIAVDAKRGKLTKIT
jgi:hypothetical protein